MNYACMSLHIAAPTLKIIILPEHTLQVMWVPADDANRSPITYNITATPNASVKESVYESVHHPITMVSLRGFPQYSTGTVSLQANNTGALSEPVNATFRMVNITGEGRKRYVNLWIFIYMTEMCSQLLCKTWCKYIS